MSSLGLGEAAGEFTDVTGADQLARGRVTAGRHGPVIAGCAAAPHPRLGRPSWRAAAGGGWAAAVLEAGAARGLDGRIFHPVAS